ncbi:NADH dehydrogenase FAD-containing subunit [Aeromicrobium panaciterrae]|uniref:NADH dehydrogenase FAD-containing subunit n=1 Tax=Aeromicrobium panaciterrae TaxID=363861 RepID=A0ABU1UJH2_9ACTN|nr:FAD-dependent oxidoreductase [Aeromicrobium panaciterrae]MDR7085334.1 NADH dehydrogenase FAD-containing subunit [Aeromicrobium panaciterrae]
MSKPRVVVAGLGDSGLLTAIHLAGDADVIGIGTKPGMVSGQELGLRLARPDFWAKHHRVPFERYRRLAGVRTVHGAVTGIDPAGRTVSYKNADGMTGSEPYDVLVIATGVTNGFWRNPDVQTESEVDDAVATAHQTLAGAQSIAIIGGGAASVGSAANLADAWPDKQIDLYFPGEAALPQHHRGVWQRVSKLLVDRGVGLHPGHRAVIPAGFDLDQITHEPVEWSTGQPAAQADAVVWAVGRVRPNSDWLPSELLDEGGFVRVDPNLRVTGQDAIFAIGDIAATDPLRTSARNRADKLLARNIRAHLKGGKLQPYKPPRRRWGSVVGTQDNGLTVFAPNGKGYRIPNWSVDTVLQPLIVRRGIYGGIKKPSKEKS